MLRRYVISQTLAYLIPGILLISTADSLQGLKISFLGNAFIVISFLLLVSTAKDRFILKVIKIDTMFNGLIPIISFALTFLSLIYSLTRKEISDYRVTVLLSILYLFIITWFIIEFIRVGRIVGRRGFFSNVISELRSITRRQVEETISTLYIIAFLSAILSLIIGDNGLIYFVVVDYVCLMCLLVLAD
jgi:hypothetical protein